MRTLLSFFVLAAALTAADKPPVYVWLEAEWFTGVSGSYAYWPDTTKPAKPTGHWGIAGPGISAEWSQGGESEWNSIGASPAETKAECHRDFVVPGRDGRAARGGARGARVRQLRLPEPLVSGRHAQP